MDAIYILLRAVIAVSAVILLVRINGLRSFSKISGYDFAITVATGSVLASTVMSSETSDYLSNLVAMASLFVVQGVLSRMRRSSDGVEKAIGNAPLLLMKNGEMLMENLRAGNITEDDVISKLREANVLKMSHVQAVVLEATGDISVLHGETSVDPIILSGIRA